MKDQFQSHNLFHLLNRMSLFDLGGALLLLQFALLFSQPQFKKAEEKTIGEG
jgi:hypothetical protein